MGNHVVSGKGAESTVSPGQHAFPIAHRVHRLGDAPRDDLRMLDEVRRRIDDAGDQSHLRRRRRFLDHRILMLMPRIGERDAQGTHLRFVEEREDLFQIGVVDMRSIPVAPANMKPDPLPRDPFDRLVDRLDMERDRVLEMQKLSRRVPLTRSVQDFAIRVLQATHPDTEEATEMCKKYVRYGGSPRGVQTLILGAKIRALLQGRYAVSIDDIHHVARPALRHRIMLNFEGEAEGVDVDAIIGDILERTPESQ